MLIYIAPLPENSSDDPQPNHNQTKWSSTTFNIQAKKVGMQVVQHPVPEKGADHC